jgi:hypothetical protein
MSRRKSKASLHDLTFEVLSLDDQDIIVNELIEGSDKACALIAIAWLDIALTALLSTKMLGVTVEERKPIFHGQTSILGSFSSKIRLCYVLSLISKDQTKHLNTMREIRNHFAHSLLPSSFEHTLVANECEPLWDGAISSKLSKLTIPRGKFLSRWTRFSDELTDAYVHSFSKSDAVNEAAASIMAADIRSN